MRVELKHVESVYKHTKSVLSKKMSQIHMQLPRHELRKKLKVINWMNKNLFSCFRGHGSFVFKGSFFSLSYHVRVSQRDVCGMDFYAQKNFEHNVDFN